MKQESPQVLGPQSLSERESVNIGIERYSKEERKQCEDRLAIEEPLEIRLLFGPLNARQQKAISVTMRTPGHDTELVAGFLMTEGILRDPGDIIEIFPPDDLDVTAWESSSLHATPRRNALLVSLSPDVAVNLATLERNFYTTSSCGICGKASILALRAVCPPRIASSFRTTARILYTLPDLLRRRQQVFEMTGGLHACGVFDEAGTLLLLREDVGRHNALDKLLGAEFLADRLPLRSAVLLLSGRASFELLQKSVMAGIPLVASIGAPSSLAVQVAQEFDVTLIGFLRNNGFNVYSGAHRIQSATGHRRSE